MVRQSRPRPSVVWRVGLGLLVAVAVALGVLPIGAADAAALAGGLFAFGRNSSGELGSATNNGNSNPNPTPSLVTLPGESAPVTQVTAGDAFGLAVTSSGQLYAFGRNTYGELGIATSSGTSNANPTPSLVTLAPGTTIDTVAKGPEADHALAIVSGLAVSSGPAGQVASSYTATLSAAGEPRR